ncbi:MAG: hypothetical protein WA740_11390 [Candidatus Binataceae bacterium]
MKLKSAIMPGMRDRSHNRVALADAQAVVQSEETRMPGAEEEVVARHWDRNARQWADSVRAGHDTYREYYNQPAMLEFVGDLRGLQVLDAGCGE